MKIRAVRIIPLLFFISSILHAGGFLFEDINSLLKVKNGATLSVNTTLLNDSGSIVKELTGTILGATNTSKISFSAGKLSLDTTIIDLTGDYLLTNAVLNLNGDKSFYSNLGSVPLSIRVSGTGNLLEGFPFLSSPLNIFDPLTTLSLGIQSTLNKNINMNGGTIYLQDNLRLGASVVISGSGVIIPNNNLINLGSLDSAWTSSLVFQGHSDVRLNARIDLSGIWTFSGYCSLRGSGNLVDLSLGGTIFIRANSTLNASDIGIEGIGLGHLIFEDTTSKLNIQNSTLTLSSNYTITTGGVYVDGSMLLVAANHILFFTQNSSLTVDGGTLWYDTLIFSDSSNIRPTVADDAILTFLRSGVIRNSQSAGTPAQLNPSNDVLVQSNNVLDESRVLQFQKSSLLPGVQKFVYNASSHEILFSRINTPMIVAGPDTEVVFNDIVFKGYSPNYLEFQSAVATSTGSIAYGDQTTIELAFAIDLSLTLTFQGTCALDGQGNILTLADGGNIVVSPNSSLTLRNLTIQGLAAHNLRCMSNTTTLVFENVTLIHDSDYSFTVGCFNVNNNLTLVGASIFSYETTIPSIILNNSNLIFDRGMTFNYQPGSANRTLLTFEDETAKIIMNGATLASTTTGINLLKGGLVIKNENRFVSSATTLAEAIKLGNGLSDANDLTIEILPGASVNIVSGYVDI